MNKIEFIVDVKMRLISFGFPVDESPASTDNAFIEFSYDKVINMIKHRINLRNIPKGLYEITVDMVVAEYLYTKDSLGQLDKDNGNMDLGATASKIQDGDTNVEFSSSKEAEAATNPAIKFANLLTYLRRGYDVDFTHYRRMLW